jgi:hypothetical protein
MSGLTDLHWGLPVIVLCLMAYKHVFINQMVFGLIVVALIFTERMFAKLNEVKIFCLEIFFKLKKNPSL